ncbi:hypothetical protein HFO06_20965 [Rhizobium leguminosarum]|uniref:hypothetical protein n=1 Tax=Rhizobium leguminosarum TaxID=384 RepID=UPI001C95BB1E|nr:hypothetical protein [Rhizobium leguminosarum]MBY5765545.1 hypothetical protein [Rhizobium leguminosarum]
MLKILLKCNRNIHAKRVATRLVGNMKMRGLEGALRRLFIAAETVENSGDPVIAQRVQQLFAAVITGLIKVECCGCRELRVDAFDVDAPFCAPGIERTAQHVEIFRRER